VESHLFSFAVTVLWILTLTNAINFMDNMNGLCAGIGLIAAWTFGWLAAQMGQYLVATLGFLIAGALVGFLPHNFPKARAFLGDSGSHLIGYLLAVLAILPHFHTAEAPRRAAVLIPLLVLAVPLLDLLSVVIIRLRAGRPFYVGDTNHFSHRLVRGGLSRTTAALLLMFLSSLAGATALLLI
jgi:UDP-GlcNAc:undecaprenyl-phosphate GlcNAc-1-phosphate transferase